MVPWETVNLALMITLRILETTPDDILKEQARENWTNWKAFVEWLRANTPDAPSA